MDATTLTLIVASALAWAGFDAARKAIGQRMSSEAAVVALMLAQVPVFAAWAAVEGAGWPEPAWLAPGLPLIALNVVSNVMFLRAVTISPLSLTIPMLAFTPVFTALFGLPAGDAPGAAQWAGVLGVVLGALLLNGERRDDSTPLGFLRALRRERGTVLMFGVAAIWGLVAVLDRQALRHAAVPVHASLQLAAMGVALTVWLRLRGRASELRAAGRHAGLLLLAGLVAVAALGGQLLALERTLASDVEAIKRAVGLVAAVIAGRLLFAEPVTRWRVLAVVLMGAGAAAVIAGA